MSNKIVFYTASGKKHEISRAHLESIRSRVITHEGQLLTGREGKNYMDKYSKKYKGKDLAGSYRDRGIGK